MQKELRRTPCPRAASVVFHPAHPTNHIAMTIAPQLPHLLPTASPSTGRPNLDEPLVIALALCEWLTHGLADRFPVRLFLPPFGLCFLAAQGLSKRPTELGQDGRLSHDHAADLRTCLPSGIDVPPQPQRASTQIRTAARALDLLGRLLRQHPDQAAGLAGGLLGNPAALRRRRLTLSTIPFGGRST
jgi:hypothetical protein